MSSNNHFSPFRYPGGKQALSDFFKQIIHLNNLEGGTYVEPFAGGAGAALSLLFSEKIYKVVLNDKDPFIYNFWKSILETPEAFIRKIEETPVNIDEYNRQKNILKTRVNQRSSFSIGFATFFMNRCNRSGILTAGPIGGKDQSGTWKVDARFNKKELIKRIERIALYSDRIEYYNLDAVEFLDRYIAHLPIRDAKVLVYLDPPYYKKGNSLYRMHFNDSSHINFAAYFEKLAPFKWIISYDDSSFIRELYRDNDLGTLELNYFANKTKVGRELIISSDNCRLPEEYKIQEQNNKNSKDLIFIKDSLRTDTKHGSEEI